MNAIVALLLSLLQDSLYTAPAGDAEPSGNWEEREEEGTKEGQGNRRDDEGRREREIYMLECDYMQ